MDKLPVLIEHGPRGRGQRGNSGQIIRLFAQLTRAIVRDLISQHRFHRREVLHVGHRKHVVHKLGAEARSICQLDQRHPF